MNKSIKSVLQGLLLGIILVVSAAIVTGIISILPIAKPVMYFIYLVIFLCVGYISGSVFFQRIVNVIVLVFMVSLSWSLMPVIMIPVTLALSCLGMWCGKKFPLFPST